MRVALAAALDAGDYFASRIDTIHEVKTKSSPSDLVTDVDPECERRIRACIQQSFPDHAVLGEESTAPGWQASMAATAEVASASHLWIVDPLDGTTNFVQGLPLSVVSIAYAEAGRLCAGVVYDPYRQEVFYAMRGAGSFVAKAEEIRAALRGSASTLPGRTLSVQKDKPLKGCVVGTGVPTRGQARDWTTAAALRLAGNIKSLRALGAAALQLAYVAAGRLDAFWEYDLNAWDLAAGVLLIWEAGGCVQSMDGQTYHLQVRDVVAAGTEATATAIQEVVSIPGERRG
ncbi:inositol-1-monophosphatase [Alicyclobacillus contaminans]|nr:inositol-1-monophosphatase [Alicyclobacillus contaminans]